MITSRGNENFICGPMVPPDIRDSVGWQFVPYERFIYTTNALRSVAHALEFNVRPLYLECGSDLDDTGKELSKRLITSIHDTLEPVEEIPERRKFFMRMVGRDPEKTRYPLAFPTTFEASRGAAAERWAVSASSGSEVLKAAEALLEYAGPDARNLIGLLKRESPKFSRDDLLESIKASIVLPSGYLSKILSAARASADYDTYFLSWWD